MEKQENLKDYLNLKKERFYEFYENLKTKVEIIKNLERLTNSLSINDPSEKIEKK